MSQTLKMSTTTKQPLLRNIETLTKCQEKVILSETKNEFIEQIDSVDQTNNVVAEHCDSTSDVSEDADDEMSWLAKVFNPTIQKVENWEEDWETASESESSAHS